MTTTHSDVDTIGTCPLCQTVIDAGQPVIKYDPPAGWPVILGECPGCGACVTPD